MSRLPQKLMDFRNSSSAIAEFVSLNHGYSASDYPWAKKMLGKFPLPPWQRDSVWTMEQKVSFIQSVYLGYDLGSVVINDYLTSELLVPKGNELPRKQLKPLTFLF